MSQECFGTSKVLKLKNGLACKIGPTSLAYSFIRVLSKINHVSLQIFAGNHLFYFI